MYANKRSRMRLVIYVFIFTSFLLAGCGASVDNQNWPGVTVEEEIVYVAYGSRVIAVDVLERQLLWSFPNEDRGGLLFYAPPAVDGENVALGDFGVAGSFLSPATTVTIYSLEQESERAVPPRVIWSRDDLAKDRIVAQPLWANDMVFVGTSDNRLLALAAANGDLVWEFQAAHSIWAEPVFHEGVIYVASLDNAVYALDAASGERIWATELSGSVASSPVLDEGVLYVSSFDRAVHALDAGSGTELWQAAAADWVWASPALGDGNVYYADIRGNIYAASLNSGERVWEQKVNGGVQSAPLYHQGRLFVGVGDVGVEEKERAGSLVALDGETGELLWQQPTRAPVFTRPVAVGDAVVAVLPIGATMELLVFNMESGAQEWTFTPPTGQ